MKIAFDLAKLKNIRMIEDNNRLEGDKDLILVQQFIKALSVVSKEMEPLKDTDTIGYVLITKLKRVYEYYKETALSNTSFDELIDYYSYLQTKEEEKEVVEKEIPLFMQLSKHKEKIAESIKNKKVMRITSTYKGYPVEIKLDGDKLYSCTIKTRYRVEDKEIFVKPIDYILYQQQGIVDSYKNLNEINLNEKIYHILEVEYRDFTLKSYYNFNTNQSFLSSISKSKNTKKEELSFTPSTNTQELIDQFITFVDSREEDKKKPKISLLDNKGNVISLCYKVREDSYIECEPFMQNKNIVGWKLIT